jgi:hypothetical protein
MALIMSREGRLGVGLGVAGIALTVVLPAGDALGIHLPHWALLISFWGGLLLLAIGVGFLIDAAVRPPRPKPPPAPPEPPAGIDVRGGQGISIIGNIVSGFPTGIRVGPPAPTPPPAAPARRNWLVRFWRWLRQ